MARVFAFNYMVYLALYQGLQQLWKFLKRITGADIPHAERCTNHCVQLLYPCAVDRTRSVTGFLDGFTCYHCCSRGEYAVEEIRLLHFLCCQSLVRSLVGVILLLWHHAHRFERHL